MNVPWPKWYHRLTRPALELRQATADDLDALVVLYEKCMRSYSEVYYPWDHNAFRHAFKPNEVEVLIYRSEIVGLVKTVLHEDHVYLAEVQMAEPMRNKGFGTYLVIRAVNHAKSLGLPLTLRVLRNNPARSLYERLGFRLVRENAIDYLLQKE